ncbi:hypothetical protein [Planomonospora parontospora]|uniref:hypothetical protein n=1 Tax=Planomonospora parontospora TaxID=58119 RepID=UPI0016713DB1|nr:hypothetical protein [Planomonospora parontospora]GGL12781.1 hypothetical protein GCM10014719_13400 [Planomonospora parontospora subsp. antibiotica]GII13998.1 hypothetical protein Ppa05_07240 [Planomonospora parontospora subsp. antibiotica]
MSNDELLLSAPPAFARELEDHLTAWSLRTGVRVEIWALPEEDLPGHVGDVVRDAIGDVLQEMERRPGTRTVSLALTAAPSGLRLTIGADGDGAVGALEARLGGRRAEFARLGGALSVNGVPGEGTTVSAAVPRRPRGGWPGRVP